VPDEASRGCALLVTDERVRAVADRPISTHLVLFRSGTRDAPGLVNAAPERMPPRTVQHWSDAPGCGPRAQRRTMNQHIRMSELLVSDEVPQPSPKYQVPFAKASAFVCKYILGKADENAICCGAPTDGRSWCAYHRRIVFDPRKPDRLR
jgi:hypothetical protein